MGHGGFGGERPLDHSTMPLQTLGSRSLATFGRSVAFRLFRNPHQYHTQLIIPEIVAILSLRVEGRDSLNVYN